MFTFVKGEMGDTNASSTGKEMVGWRARVPSSPRPPPRPPFNVLAQMAPRTRCKLYRLALRLSSGDAPLRSRLPERTEGVGHAPAQVCLGEVLNPCEGTAVSLVVRLRDAALRRGRAPPRLCV